MWISCKFQTTKSKTHYENNIKTLAQFLSAYYKTKSVVFNNTFTLRYKALQKDSLKTKERQYSRMTWRYFHFVSYIRALCFKKAWLDIWFRSIKQSLNTCNWIGQLVVRGRTIQVHSISRNDCHSFIEID